MVGDVTFQLLSRIGIPTIQTLSEMPAEVLQQMIGKNGIDIWKKQTVLTTIGGALHGRENQFRRNTPLVRTLSTFKN
jgi:nucleotidyltransferase/DNA polymerase involved in DNA repair